MKFTDSHEWIAVDKSIATVGVSRYAQGELGDIVYVELPKIGSNVSAGQEVCVLESTKAASDVYTPVSGKIVAVNESLSQNPELVNNSPQEKGWLFQVELSKPSELDALMDEDVYLAKIG